MVSRFLSSSFPIVVTTETPQKLPGIATPELLTKLYSHMIATMPLELNHIISLISDVGMVGLVAFKK